MNVTQSSVVETGRFAKFASNMQAGYFAIVLGMAGLANAWRAAAQTWHLSTVVPEAIYAVTGIVWACLIVLYVSKAILAPGKVAAEAAHPIQCCFIGLIGAATMLVAGGSIPYWHDGALALFVIGLLFAVGFGVWRTGALWRGGRDITQVTPVLYLPIVAAGLISAVVLGGLGYPQWGQMTFGAGVISWLILESVLLHRLLMAPETAGPLRATLGLQVAPASVAAVAYIAVNGAVPDLFVHALIGYGLLQMLILARLFRWIAEPGMNPGLWTFGFGTTAIAAASARLIAHGDVPITSLGMLLFCIANVVVIALIVMTVVLLATGKMFVAPIPAPAPAGNVSTR